MDNRLRCEVCGCDHKETPIIEKPLRFCSNVRVFPLPQLNEDGRKQDNICLDCLAEEIEVLKECY